MRVLLCCIRTAVKQHSASAEATGRVCTQLLQLLQLSQLREREREKKKRERGRLLTSNVTPPYYACPYPTLPGVQMNVLVTSNPNPNTVQMAYKDLTLTLTLCR